MHLDLARPRNCPGKRGCTFRRPPAAGTERRDLGRAEGSTEARSARTGTAGRKGDSGPKARRQGPESWAQTAVRRRGHHRDALRPGASPGRSCPGQAPTGTEGGQRQTAPGSPRRGAHALADCRPRVWDLLLTATRPQRRWAVTLPPCHVTRWSRRPLAGGRTWAAAWERPGARTRQHRRGAGAL